MKLASFLLPPILRSAFLMAFIKVLILPVRYVYALFTQHKEESDQYLNMSAHVAVLEHALNRHFCLADRQIYIVTPDSVSRTTCLHFESEKQVAQGFHLAEEEKPVYLIHEHEASTPISFIVMVPTFLCSSLESKEADRYGWKNLNAIRRLLNIYKPAGRTFSINLYDYE